MRAGLGGFTVFVLCIALGVGAISGVASIAHSLVEGVTRAVRSDLKRQGLAGGGAQERYEVSPASFFSICRCYAMLHR